MGSKNGGMLKSAMKRFETPEVKEEPSAEGGGGVSAEGEGACTCVELDAPDLPAAVPPPAELPAGVLCPFALAGRRTGVPSACGACVLTVGAVAALSVFVLVPGLLGPAVLVPVVLVAVPGAGTVDVGVDVDVVEAGVVMEEEVGSLAGAAGVLVAGTVALSVDAPTAAGVAKEQMSNVSIASKGNSSWDLGVRVILVSCQAGS
jgi:hypothetical protein